MIETENLTKIFTDLGSQKRKAVDSLNLKIERARSLFLDPTGRARRRR